MSKKQAFITDWAILDYFEAKNSICHDDFPDLVFSDLSDENPVILYGRAVKDPRYNPETGEWADGNMILTSLICEFKQGMAITENTIYLLGEINKEYQDWCKSNNIEWQKFGEIGFKITPEQYEIPIFIGTIRGVDFYYNSISKSNIPDMKFQLGDRVNFIDNDKEYTGVIVVQDYGGSLFHDYHTYDIMIVESEHGDTDILFKHIEEGNITKI